MEGTLVDILAIAAVIGLLAVRVPTAFALAGVASVGSFPIFAFRTGEFALIYLLLGMFLDPIGIVVLRLPLVIPLVETYGFDMIWFGVVVIKLLEIGLITPPVGLNAFVIAKVVGKAVPIDRIFAGILRFPAIDIVVLILLMAFPILSLFVPGTMR